MTRRTIKQKTIAIYPSPYINGDHWTTHYYVGPERVASRTGRLSGGFDDLHIPGNNPASAGTGVTLDYSAMCRAEEDSVASMYAQLGVPYEPQRSGTRGSYLRVANHDFQFIGQQ